MWRNPPSIFPLAIETRLALLYALTTLPRLMLLTYVPIISFQLLEDARSVSILYLTSSIGAVVSTISMPRILQRIAHGKVYAFLCAANALSYVLLETSSVLTLFAGLLLAVACWSANDILLSCLSLENLNRAEQSRYEPLRLTFSITGFTCGPIIGVLAGTEMSPQLPFRIAILFVVVGFIFFQTLNLKLTRSPGRATPNPIRYLKRYFLQPRLRLAYVLALGRAGWWQLFFVYSPIALLNLGYTAQVTGLVGSIALAMSLFIPMWAAISKRTGVRKLVLFGFGLTGISAILIAALHDKPVAVLALLVLSAFGATSLDGVGNIFFLRAVHPYERIEMASVFSTFRDAGQAVPSLLIAPLARFVEVSLLFGIGGGLLLGLSMLARRLPRGL